MFTYEIAGLKVSYAPQYPMLSDRSEKYKVEYDPAVPHLNLSDEVIKQERERLPYLDDETIEYMMVGSAFYRYLLRHNGMLLHASAVVLDDEAYLFSAPSGTGKSTHTALWLRQFGERAYILNDDKPAIRIFPEGVFAYGTPYSGKYDISENRRVPVRAIAFIERSETNYMERKAEQDALYALLNQTIRPHDVDRYVDLLAIIRSMLPRVPVYTLHCNMEPEAALLSYQTMKEGQ